MERTTLRSGSTAAAGGIRTQFSDDLNIRVGLASIAKLTRFGRAPDAEMGDLLRGRAGPPPGATTVFKSTGIATMDIAGAATALHRAASRQPRE